MQDSKKIHQNGHNLYLRECHVIISVNGAWIVPLEGNTRWVDATVNLACINCAIWGFNKYNFQVEGLLKVLIWHYTYEFIRIMMSNFVSLELQSLLYSIYYFLSKWNRVLSKWYRNPQRVNVNLILVDVAFLLIHNIIFAK